MIHADQIETALNLTGVTLTVCGGVATITADQPVTPEQQAQVKKWYDAGEINPVPHEVPMWAIRAILDLEGLTPSINTILSQLPEPGKTIVLRVWEYGNYIRRDSPTIAALTVALNKTSAEVDSYFIRADELNP